jgi:hypothetical protein
VEATALCRDPIRPGVRACEAFGLCPLALLLLLLLLGAVGENGVAAAAPPEKSVLVLVYGLAS